MAKPLSSSGPASTWGGDAAGMGAPAGLGSEHISEALCYGFCWALPETPQRGGQGEESLVAGG